MVRTRRFPLFLLLLAASVLYTGQSAHAQSADAIAQRLKQKYDTISTLRAEFTQTMASAYTDETASFDGSLVMDGQKYRVETGTQTVVTDGETTYIYLPAQNQVILGAPSADEGGMSPGEFLLNYDERFDVTATESVQLNGQKHYRLSLQPKETGSFFQEATLWMRDRDAIVTRIEVLDLNDTRMTFELTNVQLNPSVDADTFRFAIPDGAEVVDLRS